MPNFVAVLLFMIIVRARAQAEFFQRGLSAIFQIPGAGVRAQPGFLVASIVKMKEFRGPEEALALLCQWLPQPAWAYVYVKNAARWCAQQCLTAKSDRVCGVRVFSA